MSTKDLEVENISNTISYMTSNNWRERFIAEYAQLMFRRSELMDILWSIDEDVRKLYDCPLDILDMQSEIMDEYKRILEIRADIYDIDLEKEVEKLNR